MTASVVGNAAVPMLHEKHNLTVPSIGTERPAVRECDDRARAPVLVVDFSAVFGSDRAHDIGSFCLLVTWQASSLRGDGRSRLIFQRVLRHGFCPGRSTKFGCGSY